MIVVKKSSKTVCSTRLSNEPKTKLKSFTHAPNDEDPDFSWTRYWYPQKENREGVAHWINKKLNVGDDPEFGLAARLDVLLPASASSEYINHAVLAERFDGALPKFEKHAMVQAKIFLDSDEPWHHAWVRVRSFAHAHFAKRFATILIAHTPSAAAIKGQGNHVHCSVLPRRLGADGFGETCTTLCSDSGFDSARQAWREHKRLWGAGS